MHYGATRVRTKSAGSLLPNCSEALPDVFAGLSSSTRHRQQVLQILQRHCSVLARVTGKHSRWLTRVTQVIQHSSSLVTGITQSICIPGGRGQQTTQTCGSCRRKTCRRIFDGKAGSTVGPTAFESESVACLLYTSPSPRDLSTSRMPSSA